MNTKKMAKVRSMTRPRFYKPKNLIMSEETRGFLQKICYRRAATVDMTQYGFISKASPIHFLLRPLKEKLENICGPSPSRKTSQSRSTATLPAKRYRLGSGKLRVQANPNATVSIKELIKAQIPHKKRERPVLNTRGSRSLGSVKQWSIPSPPPPSTNGKQQIKSKSILKQGAKNQRMIKNQRAVKQGVRTWANMRAAEMRTVKMLTANMRAANMRTANMRAANMRTANIRAAEMRTVKMLTANMRAANMRTANMRVAIPRAAIRPGLRRKLLADSIPAPAPTPQPVAKRERRIKFAMDNPHVMEKQSFISVDY